MNESIAIIPCTSQKSTVAGPASEVWQGAHFQLTLYHAQKWYDKVLIMSYKYGLIPPDFVIEPYDIDLQFASAAEKLEWWWKVKEQIVELIAEEPRIIGVHTGDYERQRFIREFIRNGYRTIVIPWEGVPVGQRMQAVYDDDPPFNEEKLEAGGYDLPEDYAKPKQRGRPKKIREPEALEEAEWMDKE